MRNAMKIHKAKGWVFSLQERAILYRQLFQNLPADRLEPGGSFLAPVVESHVDTIHGIQGFFLEIPLKEDNIDEDACLPPFQEFLEDALVLIKVLKQEIPSQVPLALQLENNPFVVLTFLRQKSWELRWRTAWDNLRLTWEAYSTSLCDILFGISVAPTTTHAAMPRWHTQIASLLTGLAFGNRDPSAAPSISAKLLNATFIERCGPYRFERTSIVAEHLFITEDNHILVYGDWQKQFSLMLNNIVCGPYEGLTTTFDWLVCEESCYRHASYCRSQYDSLCVDLIATNLLFFMPEVTAVPTEKDDEIAAKLDPESGRSPKRLSSWIMTGHPEKLWIALRKLTLQRDRNLDIAKRVGIPLDDKTGLARFREVVTRRYRRGRGNDGFVHPDRLLRFGSAFRERIDTLHDTLRNWKPQTIWEMRYSGYGGVDPITRYAFWFSTIFGVVAILGFAATVLSTYASFKQLGIIG